MLAVVSKGLPFRERNQTWVSTVRKVSSFCLRLCNKPKTSIRVMGLLYVKDIKLRDCNLSGNLSKSALVSPWLVFLPNSVSFRCLSSVPLPQSVLIPAASSHKQWCNPQTPACNNRAWRVRAGQGGLHFSRRLKRIKSALDKSTKE